MAEEGFTTRTMGASGATELWRHLADADAVAAALDWLEAEGWLRGIVVGGGSHGGRSSTAYRINPKIPNAVTRLLPMLPNGGFDSNVSTPARSRKISMNRRSLVSAVMAVPKPVRSRI